MKTYDALIIFDHSLKDEALEKAVAGVKSEVERLEGAVAAETVLGTRSFARPMKKKEVGTYVKMRLEFDASNVAGLRSRLKLNSDVFRIQIVVADMRKREETDEKKKEAVRNG